MFQIDGYVVMLSHSEALFLLRASSSSREMKVMCKLIC